MSCIAVIPARRAERTISATLESLRFGNDDFVRRVLVVTSESDPTAAVAARWAQRDPCVELVLAGADRTAGRARNDGAAFARSCERPGDLVLFVDADCRLEAGGARRLADAMTASGAAAVTARILSERGLVARVRHMLEFKEAASLRDPPDAWLPPSTAMMCRADAFARAGGFPDLWPGEDLVFSKSLQNLGERVVRVTDVVSWHRHPSGIVEMLRHQWRLGRTASVARRMSRLAGSGFAHRPLLALLLLPGRALRVVRWQAGEGFAAFAWTVVLSPLVIAGLAMWTLAFATSAAFANSTASAIGEARRLRGVPVTQRREAASAP